MLANTQQMAFDVKMSVEKGSYSPLSLSPSLGALSLELKTDKRGSLRTRCHIFGVEVISDTHPCGCLYPLPDGSRKTSKAGLDTSRCSSLSCSGSKERGGTFSSPCSTSGTEAEADTDGNTSDEEDDCSAVWG